MNIMSTSIPDPSSNPEREGSAAATHSMQPVDRDDYSTDRQAADAQCSKYTYSIIIRNLPETWARTSTVVQWKFLQMMWTCDPQISVYLNGNWVNIWLILMLE